MCFNPIAAVAAVAANIVATKLAIDSENAAAAHNYNQQARYAERVNQAALQQKAETDSRNRIETLRKAASATDTAQQVILKNRAAMGAARASAGTSGLMGLPLNMITQNYEALLGGVGTNLQSTFQQLDENLFFNNMDSALRANSISNQAIPNKPYFQKMTGMHYLSAVLSGLSGAMGAGSGNASGVASNFAASGSTSGTDLTGTLGDFGGGGGEAMMFA